jgi:hypothetical protein
MMPPSSTKKRKHELVNDDDDGKEGSNKKKQRTCRRHTTTDDDDNDNLNQHISTTTIVRRGCVSSSDQPVDKIRSQVTSCPIPPSPVISLPYPGNAVDSARRRNDGVVATVKKSITDTKSGKKAPEITLPRCSRSILVKNDHPPVLNNDTSSIDANDTADKSNAIICATDNINNDRDDENFFNSIRHDRKQYYFLPLLLYLAVYFILIYYILVSVIYAQYYNHTLAILQGDELHTNAARVIQNLTLQSNHLVNEKLQLTTDYDQLRVHMDDMSNRYATLQRKYEIRMSESFLAPILASVHRLEQYTELQHSTILNLTSIVDSLYTSLDLCREDVEAMHIQSSRAVQAVVQAYSELAMEKTLANEKLVKHVELQLEKLEHEAIGAIQAVLEAGRSVRVREEKEVGGD